MGGMSTHSEPVVLFYVMWHRELQNYQRRGKRTPSIEEVENRNTHR
jgi:hypothetical protein